MTKFDKAIIQLQKSETAARKAQKALDKSRKRFEKAMDTVRPDEQPYSEQWKAYCDKNKRCGDTC